MNGAVSSATESKRDAIGKLDGKGDEVQGDEDEDPHIEKTDDEEQGDQVEDLQLYPEAAESKADDDGNVPEHDSTAGDETGAAAVDSNLADAKLHPLADPLFAV